MSYRALVITDRDVAIRPAENDADLEAWTAVRRIVQPNESVASLELLRAEESPDRLLVLAESDGQVVGSGVADRSHITGGYVAPRVLPEHRRHRIGSVVLRALLDHLLKTGPAVVPIDEWLREEATLPAGTFVALEHGMIVGYAGLLAWTDDAARAENGLTVVDRRWRGRGLATALKWRQIAWASAHGITEIVTWTQEGNEAMQHVNVRLGYSTRSVSRTMRRDLP